MKINATHLGSALLLPLLSILMLCSCTAPRLVLKENTRIDTLHLQLDLRLVQDFEYRQLIENKAVKFVEVYNTENHPFRLSLQNDPAKAHCSIRVVRAKFVSKQQSHIAAGVTAAGVATAVWLLTSKFFLPVGWLYIPNAKTTLHPVISSQITDVTDFPKITITSSGMYRSREKQRELQSSKVLKYIIQMVQHLEQEYQK